MISLTYILLFVFGLAVGSFLNVVVFRYNPEGSLFSFQNLRGRSRCMKCNKTLFWYELVPLISFLIQRGKCRSCGARLSLQYPLVEFIAGGIMFFVPLFLNSFYAVNSRLFFYLEAPWWHYILVIFWILVFFSLLLITIIDIRHYLIPDELNIVLFVLGLGVTIILFLFRDAIPPFRESFLTHFSLIFSPTQLFLVNRVIGIVVGTALFAGLSVFSRGRAMGFGDVKFIFAAGFLFGWPDIGLILILTFLFGGIAGVIAMVVKKKTMKDKLPFAPFLVLGMVLTFFFGTGIVQGYFDLFGL